MIFFATPLFQVLKQKLYKQIDNIKDVSLPLIELNNQLNSSEIRLSSYDTETLPPKQEIVKENKNPQYFCIFSILYFIIAGLLLIHLIQFILSKEVRNIFKYNNI